MYTPHLVPPSGPPISLPILLLTVIPISVRTAPPKPLHYIPLGEGFIIEMIGIYIGMSIAEERRQIHSYYNKSTTLCFYFSFHTISFSFFSFFSQKRVDSLHICREIYNLQDRLWAIFGPLVKRSVERLRISKV